MNGLIQMMMRQKIQKIPQQVMSQLESQLKRTNPQAFQEFQKAKQNNENPNEYLNKIVGGFNKQQTQEWNNMMSQFNGINTKK